MKVTGIFAGPLEIAIVAFCLKTQICIFQKKDRTFKKVGNYPPHNFSETSPLFLFHTPDADGTPGHTSRDWHLPKAEMLDLSAIGNAFFFQHWVDYSNGQVQESYSNPSLYDVLNVEYVPSDKQPGKLNLIAPPSVAKKLSVRLSENKDIPGTVPSPSYPETLFKTFIPQQIKIGLFKPSQTEIEKK